MIQKRLKYRIFNESSFSKLCQPSFPIPTEITEINGITNEMVEGKSIDEKSSKIVDDKGIYHRPQR